MAEAAVQKMILIVDDTPINIGVISGALKDTFATKVATSGEKALAIAGGKDKPDLILLDIMMPKLSGFEVCRMLKSEEATRQIMIFMVTALGEPGDIERAVAAGCNDFLSKPINKLDFLLRVENLLKLHHVTDELERLRRYIDEMESGRGKRKP